MKKISIASAAVALALASMPLAAFAEENTVETKPATETTTTAPETEQKPGAATDTQTGEKPAGEETKPATGEEGKDTNTTTPPATTNPEQPKQEKPKQPTEECKAEPDEADFHEITITDIKDLGNNKVKVTAKLDGKTAEGTWYIAAGKEEADAPAVEAEVKANSVNFTYELDITKLEAGENVIYVGFEGKIDGKDCQLGFGYDFLNVEEDGNDTNVKPNPDKKPEAKPTPEQGKEGVKKLKGGKLPKTATSYPMGAVAGLALLAGGAVLMVRNRRAAE
ncbi:LPXTG cell wall anchor domain-containing protein [Laceyella putida]|uniref:LPXTG cell wall anchor domain-containing protein n=1 Tax=Laceyella putida TaxID=110101 RepID=A0ABW2RJT0_9BACL